MNGRTWPTVSLRRPARLSRPKVVRSELKLRDVRPCDGQLALDLPNSAA